MKYQIWEEFDRKIDGFHRVTKMSQFLGGKMARMKVEEMMDKKITQLREAEKDKKEELSKIQNELRRYETALESLKKDFPMRKRRGKQENGTLS
jgi:SMC interacting uncharacterized protein involved in chromosome segregation